MPLITIRTGNVSGKNIIITGSGSIEFLSVGAARDFNMKKVIVSESNKRRIIITKKHNVILLYVLAWLYWFSLYVYTPIFSIYVVSLGASLKMSGLIFGSYGFTQMLLRIPLGILSDRIKTRKIIIIIGLLLCLVSSLGLWYYNNIIMILFFRCLSGIAAATWVTFNVLLFSYFEREKTSTAISSIHSIGKLGVAFSMFFGGLAASKMGLKSTFFLAAIAAMLALLLSIGINEKKGNSLRFLKREQLISVVKNKSLLLASILVIITTLISFGAIFSFVPIVAKNMEANNFQLGLLATSFALAGVIATSLSVVFFLNKIGERNTIIIGFLAITVSCIMVPYIRNIAILYIAPIISGFGNSLIITLLMVMCIKKVPENMQGTTVGFLQAVSGLGMFIGPVFMGFLSELVGLSWGFWIIGSVGCLGIIITKYFIEND